ncbi:MAG TPA: amidase, partial [Candidatus Acidoferrales bacterium]|nr:amidase [Candidatus Acidoferrales bacterium]
GTRLRAGNIATADAPLVVRLRHAGAIILGNTNVPELLMAYVTENLLHGQTNNPWDVACTPGGSSGGEAAAIAAGCSAGGIGSDGGGSIRVPAHYCGICGLKPTPGRIPSTGHYPPSGGPFALLGVVGPMARTARDLEILFEALAGPDVGDVCSAPVPVRRRCGDEIRRINIGYFEEHASAPVTPETRSVVRRAAEALRSAGFSVAAFTPTGLERAAELWWNFFGRVGATLIAPLYAGRESEMAPTMRDYLDTAGSAGPLTGEELLQTWLERDACFVRLLAEMEKFPVLLCPVSSGPAPKHGVLQWSRRDGRVSYLDAMQYSQWFNLLGNPAAVVPAGKSPEGLPIGVQIVGRPWEEENVLGVARCLEDALGPWARPPI